ncbi:MAG: hypothetical protein MUO54_15605 [Anaerolineales bacterium]|nr:hypothetical protein [Anaerolineales bacterium]
MENLDSKRYSIIILIGPMSAGKSTIAKLLSSKLSIPRYELDDVRQRFYTEIGYSERLASKIVGEEGMKGLIHYWKPFEAYAVERAVAEFENCVVDFGAGHSVYENPKLFSRVEKVLKPVENVIQILPSPDLDRSVEIVNKRFADLLISEVGKIDNELLQLNEYFVRHPSNHLLAKKTIYTENKKTDEIADEIISWVQSNKQVV